MKKASSFLTLIAVLALILTSCTGNKQISYIQLDKLGGYYTIYLYSFDNAVIDPTYESSSSDATPTAKGYVYSNDKLSPGDTIEVWKEFKFGEKESSWSDNRKSGADATVVELIKTYHVKAKTSGSMCRISYYSINDSSYMLYNVTATNKNDLPKLEQKEIEVSVDRIIIHFDN